MRPIRALGAALKLTWGGGASLWARVDATPCGQPVLVTAWEPTPEEAARLAAGAPVYLKVLGARHPPVAVTVGEPPE